MKSLHMIAFILVMIGGINWLLVGLFGWDVGQLFGGMTTPVSRLIYILVGLSALYEIFTHGKNCRTCGMKKDSMPMSSTMPPKSM